MTIESFIIQGLNGLSLIMILILISLGLVIIFGLMNVINLAHGEFFMLGAYTAVAVHFLGLPPWAGIIAAPVTVGLFGVFIERILIRPLYTRPLETLLATWGLSIAIRQVIQIIFGAGHREVPALVTGSFELLGISYPIYRFFIIAITAIILLVIFYVYFRTDFGLRIRMVIQNREMTSALGINVHATDRWAFALGSGLAGISGAVMTPLTYINPEMGLPYLGKAFIVVIIGGASTLFGVLGGGTVIGGAEAIIDFFLKKPFVAQILVLMLAILVVRIKPKGLFG
jgi:urea transport system permease protein